MGWQAFPIRYGHAPDLDVANPDAWQITGALPLDYGIGPDRDWSAQSSGTVNGTPLGAARLYAVDGSEKYFVGTATKLYQYSPSGPTSTDRSGTTYGATTSQTWSFASFGDNVLAANVGNRLQRSTGAAFSDAAANAPKAGIVVNVGFPASPQIMVFDYDDGTRYRDGWWVSALSSDTSWTVSYAAGSASGRFLEPVGPITCAVPFRDGVLAFKANAMYYGEYSPDGVNVWQWRRLSSAIGCVGKNAAVNGEDVVYFADSTGFFVFDGSYPVKLPGYSHSVVGLGGLVVPTIPQDSIYATYDQSTNTVKWTWAVDNIISSGVCYNTKSNLWTAVNNYSTFMQVRAGPYYAFDSNGVPLHRSTTRSECTITSPKFGLPWGATLSGVWPQFFNKSAASSATAVPAVDDTAWANGASFYGYKFPQVSATSTVTPVIEAGGILRGSVSGKGIGFRFDVKPALTTSDWGFGTILVDMRYGPKE